MEISYKDIYYNNKYTTIIKENEINGIIGNNIELIKSILLINNNFDIIKVDKKIVNEKTKKDIKKRISIIKKRIDMKDYYLSVYELLLREIKINKIELKNPNKKIIDSLKIVGLSTSLIDRKINTLSASEKKLLLLALGLLSNPECIIIEDALDSLDMKNEKKLYLLMQKIKDQYNKTIVIISNNSNTIYQYSTHLVIFKNNKIVVEGKTDEIMKQVELLKENLIEIPDIVDFTYKAINNKKIKIDYHKDVRDIIKDIYKHV